MKNITIITILAALLASPAFAERRSNLRPLLDQNWVEGSGCSFWLVPSSKTPPDVFQWNFLTEGRINLGASDVKLAFVKSLRVPYPQDQLALGNKHVLEFSGPSIRVFLRTKVTWVCPGNDDSCEAWRESGEMQVTSRGRTFVSPVKGICGS
jgi:hypothetical protein